MSLRALALQAVILATVGPVPSVARAEAAEQQPPRAAAGSEPGVDVSISVDGRADGQPISPWIYGLNGAGDAGTWGSNSTQQYVTTLRLGGNRWSAYNWETNWSNAGSDYGPYHNDQLLSTSARPGEAVRVPLARFYGRSGAMGSAALVTVPLLGYVAGSWTGNAPIPVAPGPATAGTPLATGPHAFVPSLVARPGDTHHQLATAKPERDDGKVYQDDFLKWLDVTFPGHKNSDREPLFISLDGEPDGWGTIHPEVRGGQHPLGPDAQGKWEYEKVELPFEDLISRSVDAARAVKDVLGQRALVFGPAMAGWTGFINLDHKRPPAGYEYFLEYYLAEMRRAGQAEGRRLLDALDVHLYPEATNGGSWAIANEYAPQEASQIVVREQAPRTFWDPQYYEQSWITQYGVVPPCGYGCAPQMIPRLERMIATQDPPFSRADGQPGTHLAISEYALYRAGDISGAIAQADMLGILGREGVYEASAWANSSEWAPGYGGSRDRAYQCLWAAFGAFLNYDGGGGHFGDVSLPITVSDPRSPSDWLAAGKHRANGSAYPAQHLERVTAYASFDQNRPGRVVVVAINKSINQDGSLPRPIRASIAVTGPRKLETAETYRVLPGVPFNHQGGDTKAWPDAAANCVGPVRDGGAEAVGPSTFAVSLPAQSITVLVLQSHGAD